MSVPRWGVHQRIKYSPMRSILKVCPVCNSFFLKNTRGKQVYCNELCSVKARQHKMSIVNQRIIKRRDKFEHANYMMKYRHETILNKVIPQGTYNPPGVPLDSNGNPDYDKYHELLSVDKQRFGLTSPH